MCTIRLFKEKDREKVEQICIATGSELAKKNVLLQEALLTVFCRYYIEQEQGNCFVAVNEQDEAVGYVFCAKDFHTWEQQFNRIYLKDSNNKMVVSIGQATIYGLGSFAEEYPAHLHINIHPEFQGKGLGTKLIDALKLHLIECEVKGLMLCVGNDNEKGKNFYRKYGFTELKQEEKEVFMGYKL
ncbi:MAG: N-acetyltransferase [Neobacillus sp.]